VWGNGRIFFMAKSFDIFCLFTFPKREVAFLKDRLLFSQSEQFKKLSKNSDWLE